MSDISNTLSSILGGGSQSSYGGLGDLLGTSSSKSSSSVATLLGTGGSSDLTSSLLGGPSDGGDLGYMLDLSPEAQSLLQQLQGNAQAPQPSEEIPDSGYELTAQQKDTIAVIMQKYKNEPLTQSTFNKILADLDAAGISASKLQVMERARTIDVKSMMLAALTGSGTTTDLFGGTTSTEAARATKLENYLAQQYISTATSEA